MIGTRCGFRRRDGAEVPEAVMDFLEKAM